MTSIEKLTELFSNLPGVGPRQARRFVYYLLSSERGFIKTFTDEIQKLQVETFQCSLCLRYFTPKKSVSEKVCDLCTNPVDTNTLLVVEKDIDLDNVRKTGAHHGYYFVLGGVIPILEKDPDSRIRIQELRKRLETEPGIKEVILALSANPVGDNTADYVKLEISKLRNIKISVLGRGLSTGTELEYSDAATLSHALQNRR